MDNNLDLNDLEWEQWADFVDRWRGGEEITEYFENKTYWVVSEFTYLRGLREMRNEGEEDTETYRILESLKTPQFAGIWRFDEAQDRDITGVERVVEEG